MIASQNKRALKRLKQNNSFNKAFSRGVNLR
ncbi:hypothetical protein HPPN135_04520 [Helicobacter pylori Puno135]|nr:hypothetical protein HPPN135_04520 [Helicobacter pylori Puno135]